MTELATVEVDRLNGVPLARIRGEIDLSNAGDVQAAVEAAGANASRLVLDLSETEYLDSAGIRVLFQLARAMSSTGCRVRAVVPPQSPIRRVLELAGIDQAIPLDDSAAEALDRLAAG